VHFYSIVIPAKVRTETENMTDVMFSRPSRNPNLRLVGSVEGISNRIFIYVYRSFVQIDRGADHGQHVAAFYFDYVAGAEIMDCRDFAKEFFAAIDIHSYQVGYIIYAGLCGAERLASGENFGADGGFGRGAVGGAVDGRDECVMAGLADGLDIARGKLFETLEAVGEELAPNLSLQPVRRGYPGD
jgi:hypothetical protein